MAPRSPRFGFLLFFSFLLIFFLIVFARTRAIEKIRNGDLALVRIEGVILDSKEILDQLKRYRKDDSLRAIVLRVDSPGGAVVPSQEIYREVRAIRDEGKKKIVASMGTVAASGGYYIAAGTERIVANPGTLTGSIGVIMELPNIEGLLSKIGVRAVTIKSGERKDTGSPFRKMSVEERALLQSVLDDVHAQFIEAVASSRSLPEKEVRALADGRIFTGRQAKEKRLVDDLGGLDDAIKIAAEMAGIKGEPRLVESKPRFSIFDLFRDRIRLPAVELKYLMSF